MQQLAFFSAVIRNALMFCVVSVLTLSVSEPSLAKTSGSAFAESSPQPTMEKILSKKERLEFSVHYGFLTLGYVTIDAVRDTLYNGENVHTFTTIIRSNPSIPFVGRKERHYHSIFKTRNDTLWGLNFWTDNVSKEEFLDSRYIFDYEAGHVLVHEFEEVVDTLALTQPADSGPLLFFLTRLHAGTDETVNFPIYISGEEGNVKMDYTSRIDRLDVPAFGRTNAYFSSGDAAVDGPFGFSGFYRAWHKADDLRVPLEAHVRVWVGNVRVRLQSYERYD